MKKLYKWADDYCFNEIPEDEAYDSYELLITFLKYVWEHRNND